MNTQYGVHMPNAPMQPGDWLRLGMADPHWVKFLQEDTTVAEVGLAHQYGMKTILRAKGEGVVNFENVLAIIDAYRGALDAIEIGNEPDNDHRTDLWTHNWYTRKVLDTCLSPARAAGIQLITPGWSGTSTPPGLDGLGVALHETYSDADGIGLHLYDVFELATGAQDRRIDAWRAQWGKPIWITEAGIAARWLISGSTDQDRCDLEKAARYSRFFTRLRARAFVTCACVFMLGGTEQWAAFDDGPYTPTGHNRYFMSAEAWIALGSSVG